MYGIEFNGKHSYKDFGITLGVEKNVGYPEKEKIKVKVPFSNIEYDFSQIYGEQTYTPRPLTYTLNVLDKNNTTEKINVIETKLSNWLMNSNGKKKLYDDTIPGYYFLAEVEGLSFDELWNSGTLTVEFTAYPFMISELEEGHDRWDDINFDLDILQPVEFTVNGTLNITLFNVGTPSLSPEIQTSSAMQFVKDGVIYNAPAGLSKSEDFKLQSGENDLRITGNGTIKFLFHKELI
ncbi:phage tail protein [Oceanobacillus arenosus]|uniref:Phage tail protein n=1 Tax=Oceanobacillus arenosus TaxID=1229153 RepID=A0A3D8Q220_9BACI|nr:phage tail protein [Oceanobacillus arenosus]RDW21045.1 phage tail protein [Oceanobacillus arenosus]